MPRLTTITSVRPNNSPAGWFATGGRRSIRLCTFRGSMCKPTAATTVGRFPRRNSFGWWKRPGLARKRSREFPGPDRAMMYILASWTGFRKGEIGSLTLRSFDLDADPPTLTVGRLLQQAAAGRHQILHPELVVQFKDWLALSGRWSRTAILFPYRAACPARRAERPTR